ncbi:MAG TPA: hypothetical protein VF235_00540 [Actinomycetota bacterium]
MTRLAILLALVVSVAACGEPAATARIEGAVLAGPTCPVVSPGADCDPVPWIGTVRATGEDGSVHEGETDTQGRFAIDLPPGTYVVVAVTETGGPPTGIPQTVPVVAGQPLRVDLEVDTGIR